MSQPPLLNLQVEKSPHPWGGASVDFVTKVDADGISSFQLTVATRPGIDLAAARQQAFEFGRRLLHGRRLRPAAAPSRRRLLEVPGKPAQVTYQPRDLPRPRRRHNCSLCGCPGHVRSQCSQYDPLRAPGTEGRGGGAADEGPTLDTLSERPTEADRLSAGFHMLSDDFGS